MGCNTSSATIEFPARFLDDEIRDCLVEHENVIPLNGPLNGPTLGDLVGLGDTEVEISEGIFRLHDSEVCYGIFEDLEDLLKKKGVPFDRYTSIIPCNRIFRPRPVAYDHEFILNPDTDDIAVNLKDIRTLIAPGLRDKDDEGNERNPWEAVEAILNLASYLDDNFPAYPPLADYVKEEN